MRTVLRKFRKLGLLFSVLFLLTGSATLFSQTNEELVETIIKGIRQNESSIQSVTFDLDFEYFFQQINYDVQIERAKQLEATKEEIQELEREKQDPVSSGSHKNVGKVRFFLKGNRLRIDADYTQTIFDGPIDPRSEKEEDIYSEHHIKETYYHSPTEVTSLSDKILFVGDTSSSIPFIFPPGYGLGWAESERGVQRRSDILSKYFKEGKLKLAGQEEVNGSMCYVIEGFNPEQGIKAKTWTDPNKGYTVSKINSSFIIKHGELQREFPFYEKSCTVKKVGDVWIPETGVEKYYDWVDPNWQKLEDAEVYLQREERIKITNCVLNTVADKDLEVPNKESGEYERIDDMKTGKVFDLTGKEIEFSDTEEVDSECE